ncbi:ABC transporter ATP-binding protein [Georgenia sp. H159]|uniref:ABC transporter ATP-binding protein n=1 Tax=Georgenia sp. H159 TaxID=3076115 RepID=UPI002D79378D|nr:ABC transporter ATP-binding protein [Georgenia sp. H159]
MSGRRGPAIEVVSLRKTYGDVAAVADVSFSVARGEILGVLGHNGAGKTTTVECLQALRRPDGGTIRVAGVDPVAHPGRVRALVGSQLQSSSLPDRLRVGEALEFFASLRPGSRSPGELMREWGLSDLRRRAFGDLSGGQQQRLFVALALVNDPPVVVLDEMTTGLDPAARRVAWELVERVRDRGATVLLVTHFMDEAERLCDRLVVLSGGRVVATGSPGELVDRHAGEVEVTFSHRGELPGLAGTPGVTGVHRSGARVVVTGTGPLLARVAHHLVTVGIEPQDLAVHRPSLEDVYLALTGQGTP